MVEFDCDGDNDNGNILSAMLNKINRELFIDNTVTKLTYHSNIKSEDNEVNDGGRFIGQEKERQNSLRSGILKKGIKRKNKMKRMKEHATISVES